MFEDIYERNIYHTGFSVFSGGKNIKGYICVDELRCKFSDGSIIRAFINDDDIQEIRVTSANIGFSRTYRKILKKDVGGKK